MQITNDGAGGCHTDYRKVIFNLVKMEQRHQKLAMAMLAIRPRQAHIATCLATHKENFSISLLRIEMISQCLYLHAHF